MTESAEKLSGFGKLFTIIRKLLFPIWKRERTAPPIEVSAPSRSYGVASPATSQLPMKLLRLLALLCMIAPVVAAEEQVIR
ncbi:hypothetical protein [Haloferula sp. BvORR071]|uniref:hypothetical protein n=1 Tax=Haloferula sp. BvORR071 TaxID=1396141 RepID=UPI0005524647|nr:hypothetical protein [Haloferula sp. BvORR071]